MKKLHILAAILFAFSWGSNYTAVQYVLAEIPGFLALAIRFLITALLLLPFVKKPNIKFGELYAISMVYGFFYMGLLYYGLYLGINTSLTIIIMQLHIPLTVILAYFLFKEHIPITSIIGIVTAFIGMLIVVGKPGAIGSFSALFIILLAAFFSAVFNIQSKKLTKLSPLTIVFWTNLISAPHLFLVSYFLEGNPVELLKNATYFTWLGTAYNVVIASFCGLSLWIYLLQKYPVYKVAPYSLLVPFFGIAISVIMLGDELTWHVIIGGIVTILGVALSNADMLPFIRNKKI